MMFGEAYSRAYARAKAERVAEVWVGYHGEAWIEGWTDGWAGGKAEALMTILLERGLAITAAQRQQILACTDLVAIEIWLLHALSAASVAELLA